MSETHVEVQVESGVAQVWLNRPDKLNGLTLGMLHELRAAATDLAADSEVRAVIVAGRGRSFSAGLDFASVMPDREGLARAFAPLPDGETNLFQEACWAWRRLEVPVIAAVHGHCFGGGLQLALAADFRVTSPEAQWSVLEVKWGLVPDMTGVATLAQQVGMDIAKLLTMTGRVLSGTEARDLGLATVVASDPLQAAADLAQELLARSPDALAASKRLFQQTWGRPVEETFAAERIEQERLLALPNTAIAQRLATSGQDQGQSGFDPRAPR